MTGDDQAPRTLYVGNLNSNITEELLLALFSKLGECKSCKIIHEKPGSDPYAFIEFADPHAAAAALAAMNKRNCLGKEMKVNWATTSGSQSKLDSKHYHIFVGDLAPEIDQAKLREAFAPFGEISDVKIMKDPHTLAHKGYGFVSFINKMEAENAINNMNGQWLGTRKIRTNWATRKVQSGGGMDQYGGGVGNMGMGMGGQKYGGGMGGGGNKLDFNEVWNRASETNCTVYCGGIANFTEDLVRNTFGLYGQIVGVHAFPDRGYAFVRFMTKEAACHAICAVHGLELNGGIAKCSWGKENIDITNNSAAAASASLSAQSMLSSQLYGGGGGGNAGNVGGASGVVNAQQAAAAAAALAAQNLNLQTASQLNANSAWGAAGAGQNSNNWAASNYQWAGYPQNAMNYWQNAYPGAYAMQQQQQQQGWGVMPNAASGASAGSGGNGAGQYQMGQYQQGSNGKS